MPNKPQDPRFATEGTDDSQAGRLTGSPGSFKMSSHIVLTSHPFGRTAGQSPPLKWGAASAAERGPVVASLTNPAQRNAIGTHSGAYALYRALAVASGRLDRDHRPDLTDTSPAEVIGPHPQWADPDKIVSLDPWGHLVASVFAGGARRRASICGRRSRSPRRGSTCRR